MKLKEVKRLRIALFHADEVIRRPESGRRAVEVSGHQPDISETAKSDEPHPAGGLSDQHLITFECEGLAWRAGESPPPGRHIVRVSPDAEMRVVIEPSA